jgi:aminopeptidase-like protein
VVVSTMLAHILSKIDTYFSYRFLFVPETIGTITWLFKNQKNLSKIKGGLVITCVGDNGDFTYKKTKQGNSTIDKIVDNIFKQSNKKTKTKNFFPYGSDERQFCSPGINLPVGVFMRTPYYEFKEYHTADDNLKFVSKTGLKDSLSMILKIILDIETKKNIEQQPKIKKNINDKSKIYLNLNPKCEPQLGKRNLYRKISKRRLVDKENSQDLIEISILWILNYSDGNHSLKDISKISGLPINLLEDSSQLLLKKHLLKKLN